MANSFVLYTADGSTATFTYSFEYLLAAHVKVYVNGVEDTTHTKPTASSVTLTSLPSNGDIILIRRETPRDALTVTIPNSGTFRGRDINTQSKQALYVAEEGFDALSDVISKNLAGLWDAESTRIINVDTPVDTGDAVNKAYADTIINTAAASAAAAASSASSASTSAVSALASKNAAATSETNSAASAAAASASATSASGSATTATTKAAEAAASATSASGSATTATTKAAEASASATAAATSETNAGTSETNAAASATAAAGSASAAGSAQTAAEAAYDSFDDRYLGPKAAAPTVDNDGNALLTGALYFNSTDNLMYVWTGSAWADFVQSSPTDAADVAFTTAGDIAATDVQAAIEELDAEKAIAAVETTTITFIIDGGGAAITTGEKGHTEIPFNCTIQQVTAMADQSGSIVVDIWKDTYANYPPTDADSITASAPVTISSATKSQDSTLTGWTKTIAAGDILAFNVDSITSIQRLSISLKVLRT